MERDEDQDEGFIGNADEGDPMMWEEDPGVCRGCGEPPDEDDEDDEDSRTIDDIASRLPEEQVTEWCEEWLSSSAGDEEVADFIVAELEGDGELAALVQRRMAGGQR